MFGGDNITMLANAHLNSCDNEFIVSAPPSVAISNDQLSGN